MYIHISSHLQLSRFGQFSLKLSVLLAVFKKHTGPHRAVVGRPPTLKVYLVVVVPQAMFVGALEDCQNL